MWLHGTGGPLWSHSSVTWQAKTRWLSLGEEKSNQACCHTHFPFFFLTQSTLRDLEIEPLTDGILTKKKKKICGVEQHRYNRIQNHLMRSEATSQKIPPAFCKCLFSVPSLLLHNGLRVKRGYGSALEGGSLEQNRCRPRTKNMKDRCPNRKRSKKF